MAAGVATVSCKSKFCHSHTVNTWLVAAKISKLLQHPVNGPLRSIHTMRQRQWLFCTNGAKVFTLVRPWLWQPDKASFSSEICNVYLICHCRNHTKWGWNLFTCGTVAAAATASARVNDSTCYYGIQLLTLPLLHRVNGPLRIGSK